MRRERVVAVADACLLTDLDLEHQKLPTSIGLAEGDCWTTKGIHYARSVKEVPREPVLMREGACGVGLTVDSLGELSMLFRFGNTHDRSSGVAGWEEPPMVCAKLDIGPLFGRGFPRPALPIGTPPPNAHVAPLLARLRHQHQHIFSLLDQL